MPCSFVISSSLSRAQHPFELIHCGLWTSPVLSILRYKYYLLFLHDFTHYLWTFPIKLSSFPMCGTYSPRPELHTSSSSPCSVIMTCPRRASASPPHSRGAFLPSPHTSMRDRPRRAPSHLLPTSSSVCHVSFVICIDWPIHQLDDKNAFLNGTLQKMIYC